MVDVNQYFAEAGGVYDTTPQAAIHTGAADQHLLLGEFGRGFNDDDDSITSLNAIKHGLVWACINVIAGDLGQIPLNVVRETEGGCETVPDHPVHVLFNHRPNPYQTPSSFVEFMASQMLVWGNAFAEIVRDARGQVLSLMPIPSQYMKYYVDSDGEPFYYAQLPVDDGLAIYGLDDVIHFSQLQGNAFWGYRLVEIAFPELRLARSNLRHASASYANGAVPSGVLQHPGKLPKEAREELRRSWQETHGGSRNRGKTALLWEGMEYNALSASAHDAQLMESIEHNPRLIGMLFQLAPYKLGDWSQSSTRANLEDSQKEYFQSTLSRRLHTLVQEMNYKLFGKRERGLCIKPDPTELLKGDRKTQMETAQIAMASTVWTRNEARQYVGMNTVDGGDEFVNPNTTANAGQEPLESDGDSQDVANRMRALVVAQSRVVCSIEKNRISSRAKTKHPTANIKAHYSRDFAGYAADALQPVCEAADGLIPLVPLSQSLGKYADVAQTRALTTPVSEWGIDENARLLASLILGEPIE